MNHAEAKRVILLHAVGIQNPDGSIDFEESGYIGSLRPYIGIRHQNFHSVVEALLVVGEQLHMKPDVDRELVHAIWDLTSTARRYGIRPGGMLKRNKLISDSDAATLEEWNDIVESMALGLLQGLPPYRQIERYASYISRDDHCGNLGFTIPYFRQWLQDPECNDPSEILPAILRLGSSRSDLLEALNALKVQTFPEYCRQECSDLLDRVIKSCIECEEE